MSGTRRCGGAWIRGARTKTGIGIATGKAAARTSTGTPAIVTVMAKTEGREIGAEDVTVTVIGGTASATSLGIATGAAAAGAARKPGKTAAAAPEAEAAAAGVKIGGRAAAAALGAVPAAASATRIGRRAAAVAANEAGAKKSGREAEAPARAEVRRTHVTRIPKKGLETAH